MTMLTYHLPTIPYSVADAVNRMSAATGSVRYAMGAARADYNGHHVSVYFNDYRRYWLAEYTWSGRNVLARGSLVNCLRAAKSEYDRGALGSDVVAKLHPTAPDSEGSFRAACRAEGLIEGDEDKKLADWWTDRHGLVSDAMEYERHGLAPAVGILVNAKNAADYKAKLDAYFAVQKAARRVG